MAINSSAIENRKFAISVSSMLRGFLANFNCPVYDTHIEYDVQLDGYVVRTRFDTPDGDRKIVETTVYRHDIENLGLAKLHIWLVYKFFFMIIPEEDIKEAVADELLNPDVLDKLEKIRNVLNPMEF